MRRELSAWHISRRLGFEGGSSFSTIQGRYPDVPMPGVEAPEGPETSSDRIVIRLCIRWKGLQKTQTTSKFNSGFRG